MHALFADEAMLDVLDRLPAPPPMVTGVAVLSALVMTNRADDSAAATTIYRAIADPLERLGRDQAAARARSLADL